MMEKNFNNCSLEEIKQMIEKKKQENSDLRKEIIKKNKMLKELLTIVNK